MLSSKIILILAALFLLFPNYINLTTVRRSFKGDGPMEIIDQVRDVAQAILEDKDILTKYDWDEASTMTFD